MAASRDPVTCSLLLFRIASSRKLCSAYKRSPGTDRLYMHVHIQIHSRRVVEFGILSQTMVRLGARSSETEIAHAATYSRSTYILIYASKYIHKYIYQRCVSIAGHEPYMVYLYIQAHWEREWGKAAFVTSEHRMSVWRDIGEINQPVIELPLQENS